MIAFWLSMVCAVLAREIAPVTRDDLDADQIAGRDACAEEMMAVGDDECSSVHWEEDGGTSCVTVIDFECMIRRVGNQFCTKHVKELNDPCVSLLGYDAESNACMVHTDMTCRGDGLYATGWRAAKRFWLFATRLLDSDSSSSDAK